MSWRCVEGCWLGTSYHTLPYAVAFDVASVVCGRMWALWRVVGAASTPLCRLEGQGASYRTLPYAVVLNTASTFTVPDVSTGLLSNIALCGSILISMGPRYLPDSYPALTLQASSPHSPLISFLFHIALPSRALPLYLRSASSP